jgi:hypothetical protein
MRASKPNWLETVYTLSTRSSSAHGLTRRDSTVQPSGSASDREIAPLAAAGHFRVKLDDDAPPGSPPPPPRPCAESSPHRPVRRRSRHRRMSGRRPAREAGGRSRRSPKGRPRAAPRCTWTADGAAAGRWRPRPRPARRSRIPGALEHRLQVARAPGVVVDAAAVEHQRTRAVRPIRAAPSAAIRPRWRGRRACASRPPPWRSRPSACGPSRQRSRPGAMRASGRRAPARVPTAPQPRVGAATGRASR